jgi:ATP-dependent DNA helicase RecG
VGPSIATKLEKLNILTVADLLFHLPLRYQDRTRVVPIGGLRPGAEAVIEGEVLLTEVAYRRRRMLLCRLADGSGAITLRFFHFSDAQQQALMRGARLRCFGEARTAGRELEMIHPEYSYITAGVSAVAEYMTPIYPATAGISQI